MRIFNDKFVDEIAILDISASQNNRPPNLSEISDIASEAFMPLSYGGGITSLKQIEEILYNGVEKVTLNHSALNNPSLIEQAAKQFGSQSIVVSIDVKSNLFKKYHVYANCGKKKMSFTPENLAKKVESYGAGEIFLNSIDRDGTYQGYDLNLIEKVSNAVEIPVIACGGASEINDFKAAVNKGASAVAAGSMFVFQRPHNAVLISYPSQENLSEFYETL